jgi:hypothetical protein
MMASWLCIFWGIGSGDLYGQALTTLRCTVSQLIRHYFPLLLDVMELGGLRYSYHVCVILSTWHACVIYAICTVVDGWYDVIYQASHTMGDFSS